MGGFDFSDVQAASSGCRPRQDPPVRIAGFAAGGRAAEAKRVWPLAHSNLDVRHPCKRLQAVPVSRMPKQYAQLALDLCVVDALVVFIEAARHRREIGVLERNFRGRRRAEEFSRIEQNVLRRRRLVIRNIINTGASATPLAPNGDDHSLRDILDMNAVENLTGFHDAAGVASTDPVQRAPPWSVDSRQPENVERSFALLRERCPRMFRLDARGLSSARRRRWGFFVNPFAMMLSINADCGEVSDPSQLRNIENGWPKSGKRRVALIAWRR